MRIIQRGVKMKKETPGGVSFLYYSVAQVFL